MNRNPEEIRWDLDARYPPAYLTRTFGRALAWHLFRWGTRPQGSPARRGPAWERAEFASELAKIANPTSDAEAIGNIQRNLDNWLLEKKPSSLKHIEAALFGNNPDYDHWCDHLRRRFEEPFVFVPPPDMPRWSFPVLGRENDLTRLHKALSPSNKKTPARLVISGMPGVGKTTLAVDYIRHFGAQFEDVWWCNAETPLHLLTALSKLHQELAGEASHQSALTRSAESALQLVSSSARPWLLVYDNVAFPDHLKFQSSDGQSKRLLPADHVRILITSRSPFWSSWAEDYPLEVLAPDQAEEVLLRKANPTERVGAAQLARRLGRLPLALDHAGALCRSRGLSFGEYEKHINKLIKEVPRHSAAYESDVDATFNVAIDAVVEEYADDAERVVAIISYCAPDKIPLALLDTAVASSACPRAIVEALAELSIVHVGIQGSLLASHHLSVHQLVQEVGRDRAQSRGFSEQAIDSIVGWLCDRFPTQEDAAHTAEAFTSHVLALLSSGAIPSHQNWSWLLAKAGSHAILDLHHSQRLFQEAVKVAERVYGEQHPALASRLFEMAYTAEFAHDERHAKALYERSLRIARSTLSSQDSFIGLVLTHLGSLKVQLGDYLGGKADLAEGLHLHPRRNLPNKPAVAANLTKLANHIAAEGTLREAIDIQRSAIWLLELVLTDSHPDVHMMMSNLALHHFLLGEFPEAAEILEVVISGVKRFYGSDHPIVMRSAYLLAAILARQDCLPRARSLFREVTKQYANSRPKGQLPDQLFYLFALALAHCGVWREALSYARKALKVREVAFGPGDDRTRAVAKVAVQSLNSLGRKSDAIALAERHQIHYDIT